MAIHVDTSVLVRWSNSAQAMHQTAVDAVLKLHARKERLMITGQNLIEFWNVATRPLSVNGLGLSIQDAEYRLSVLEKAFQFLDDTPDIFPAWRQLVTSLGVQGKQVHDARLVAVCHVHGISDILTFNVRHFQRLVSYWPGMNVIDPATV